MAHITSLPSTFRVVPFGLTKGEHWHRLSQASAFGQHLRCSSLRQRVDWRMTLPRMTSLDDFVVNIPWISRAWKLWGKNCSIVTFFRWGLTINDLTCQYGTCQPEVGVGAVKALQRLFPESAILGSVLPATFKNTKILTCVTTRRKRRSSRFVGICHTRS